MLRGFPVGAFLFSPYNFDTMSKYGNKEFRLAKSNSSITKAHKQFSHYLLDGQQRATSIALGFHDIWDPSNFEAKKDGPALWLDLGPANGKNDCEFVFRLTTRSHPWGYKRSNSEERLEASHIRNAIENFKLVSPELGELNPAEFPLQNSWPWDAHAPIPLTFLIKALRSGRRDIGSLVKGELSRLPFWDGPNAHHAKLLDGTSFKSKLLSALDGTDALLTERFDHIVNSMRLLVCDESDYGIPALMLPDYHVVKSLSANLDPHSLIGEAGVQKDPVETLFVRVNAGGTRLEGDELIYSLLKSAWKEAPQAIESMQPSGHQLLAPAKMVTLITRVLLARQQKADQGKFPAPPPRLEVTRFRNWIREKGSLDKLIAFTSGPAGKIAKNAYSLLALNSENSNTHPFRLPPSLVAKVTQGDTGADVMLLLLVWLDRMMLAKRDPLAISLKSQQQLLGFLTALTWFSQDSSACVRRLWQQLKSCSSNALPTFFNHIRFKSLLTPDWKVGLIVLPIVSPDVLESVIRNRVTRPRMKGYEGFDNFKSSFWKSNLNWHYGQWLVTDDFKDLDPKLKAWYLKLPIGKTSLNAGMPASPNAVIDKSDRNEQFRDAWMNFLSRIWSENQLIDYAQRDRLIRWFPSFDPTLPDQMEDINRPWDYDHIHAYNFVKGKKDLPSVVKDWHNCIGNLRAWPMELNRADQDIAPRVKLSWPDTSNVPSSQDSHLSSIPEARYLMQSEVDIRQASFVSEGEWPLWENTVPIAKLRRYLAQPRNAAEHRHRADLVAAITSRFCRIYREWYTSLHVGDLCK
jgi:hypothetical protein